MKKILFFVIFFFFLFIFVGLCEVYDLKSPDGNILVNVNIGNKVKWSIYYKKEIIIKQSSIELLLSEDEIPGFKPEVKNIRKSSQNKLIKAVVPTKSNIIRDEYNELILEFSNNFCLIFRAYNTGVAYRFKTLFDERIRIFKEKVEFNFAPDCLVYFPEENSFVSHYENLYQRIKLTNIKEEQFCSLPVLLRTENNVKILITEADLYDYPGMFLSGTQHKSLVAKFPKVVLKTKPGKRSPDRSEVIVKHADYIVETCGKRNFPWRVLVITDDDKDLINNQLVFNLSRPLKLKDVSWIKPGKVAWDWWNALNIYGVDFKSGINTKTYKYYIDFASKYNLEYIIMDEGWSKSTTELLSSKPEINLKEIINYGKQKNVGVILWVLWKPLNKNMKKILDTFKSWGVKGIKVDFMQRADQFMVNYYEKVAREAAKRKLVVDFHGAFKPSGLRRAFPNVLTYEGVKGLEHSKWNKDITPEHDVTIPFTRMIAGPMDFTPGAMINAQKNNFCISFTRPMSQGTRCHQMAMYIIYESPLQMLCDSPSNYIREDECVKFISNIPTTWDRTIVLEAKVGDFVVMAREKDDDWYIGAMTDWEARSFNLGLSFLEKGNFKIEIFSDGINAGEHAQDYRRTLRGTNRNQVININLESGGGWVAKISKIE